MGEHLDEYKARAFVVGPSNGTAYDPAADLAAFQNLLRTRRSSNLKIIGVGAGATFVNNVIAKHAFAVAGILTTAARSTGRHVVDAVPAYVHAADARSPAVSSRRTAPPQRWDSAASPPTRIRAGRRTAARRREQAAGREGDPGAGVPERLEDRVQQELPALHEPRPSRTVRASIRTTTPSRGSSSRM